jgi:FkbM family methyltransferase
VSSLEIAVRKVDKSMRGLINLLHRILSKSRVCAKTCVKLRNQANCVLGYHLGESADPSRNGEYRLVDVVAPSCHTFVDVGANVGNWTEYFLRGRTALGFLFEPSEQCLSVLEKRFKDKQVTLRNVAVGERCGFVPFIEDRDCGEGSSASETHGTGLGRIREVPVVTLDQELLDFSFNIDFLKIDAEGYDLRVLKGAEGLLRAGRVRFVQFEYNAHWLGAGSSLVEAQRFLESTGFQLLLIRSSGLHRLNYTFWGDYFRYSNFLAYRQEDKHIIRSLLNREF